MKTDNDFVGSEFETPKGGTLKVVSLLTERESGGAKRYGLECTICSKDHEVWPASSIKSNKGNLVRGRIPCGCSRGINYSLDQLFMLVKRKLESKGLEFNGFSGEDLGIRTRLNINCKKHGPWSTSWALTVLRNDSGCPKCGDERCGLKNRMDPKDAHSMFMDTGAFAAGTVFTKIEKKTRQGSSAFWNVWCPVCASDEYSLSGSCPTDFIAFHGSLAAGMKPCRCSIAYKYTKSELDYRAIKAQNKHGVRFICWSEKAPITTDAIVIAECSEHGQYEANFAPYEYSGGCPGCASRGFRPAKNGYIYILESDCGAYTKVGISHVPEKRFKQLSVCTPFAFKVVDKFYVSGEDAVIIETDTHNKFERAGLTGFGGFSEWLKSDPGIIEYIQQRAL